MRYYRQRIKAWLKGWKNQPSQKEVESLYKHYRNEVMSKEILNNHFDRKEFTNLIRVVRYTDFGLWTALQAAFCLGFQAGSEAVREEIFSRYENKGSLEKGGVK